MKANYALLVAGHIISTLGSSIYLVALVLYLSETADSPRLLGTVQFLAYLPAAIIGPLAGTIVDRLSRKTMIVATDLLRGAVMLLAGLSPLLLGGLTLPVVMASTVLISIAGVFFVPAVHAIMPDLAPGTELKRANGIRTSGVQMANLAGSAIGGLLFALLGAPLLFVANGISFLLSGISELFIHVPTEAHRPASDSAALLDQAAGASQVAAAPSLTSASGATPALGNGRGRAVHALWSQTMHGLRTIMRTEGLRTLIMVQALAQLLLPPLVVALPFVIDDLWGLEAGWFGYYFALVLAGGVAAFLLLSSPRVGPDEEGMAYRAALPAIALVLVAAGALSLPGPGPGASAATSAVGILHAARPYLLMLLFMLMGMAVGALHLVGITRLQQHSHAAIRGRLFAASETIVAATLPAAYALSGLLVEAVRDRLWLVFFAVALLSLLLGTYVLLSRPADRVLSGIAAPGARVMPGGHTGEPLA